MEEFAYNLKRYRNRKGYSCSQLSKLIEANTGVKVTNKALSNYENDRREPSLKILKAIAKSLDIKVDDLLSFRNDNTAKEIAKIKEMERKLDLLKSRVNEREES